jgi:hypothetical protein
MRERQPSRREKSVGGRHNVKAGAVKRKRLKIKWRLYSRHRRRTLSIYTGCFNHTHHHRQHPLQSIFAVAQNACPAALTAVTHSLLALAAAIAAAAAEAAAASRPRPAQAQASMNRAPSLVTPAVAATPPSALAADSTAAAACPHTAPSAAVCGGASSAACLDTCCQPPWPRQLCTTH